MKQIHTNAELMFGFAPAPFGECCIVYSEEKICSLIFPEDRESGIGDIKKRFPMSAFKQDDIKAIELAKQIFEKSERPVLTPAGTPFQLSVWEALQRIPAGETSTYARIASAIGRPKAVRAVGTAIGANPIAYLIPCHRVMRTDGALGGFRWGLKRKEEMLKWERR